MRVKCATLAWHTFEAAFEQKDSAEPQELREAIGE
jgi:NifU-like protein involved in Fe-S cluster formation